MMKIRDVLRRRKFDTMIRAELVALGFSECLSNSDASAKTGGNISRESGRVMNPLTVELERMRRALFRIYSILPGEMSAMARAGRDYSSPEMFLIILKRLSLSVISPNEQNFAILLKDDLEEKNPYNTKELKADMYALRGAVAQIFTHAKIEYEANPISDSGNWTDAKKYFDANETLAFTSGKDILCLLGKLSASVQKEYDLRTEVYAAVIDYEKLHSLREREAMNPPAVKSLPKFSGKSNAICRCLPMICCRKTYRDC